MFPEVSIDFEQVIDMSTLKMDPEFKPGETRHLFRMKIDENGIRF